MADSIKIDISAGYAADFEKCPAGTTATRVVLTVWQVERHSAWSMEVLVALTRIVSQFGRRPVAGTLQRPSILVKPVTAPRGALNLDDALEIHHGHQQRSYRMPTRTVF